MTHFVYTSTVARFLQESGCIKEQTCTQQPTSRCRCVPNYHAFNYNWITDSKMDRQLACVQSLFSILNTTYSGCWNRLQTYSNTHTHTHTMITPIKNKNYWYRLITTSGIEDSSTNLGFFSWEGLPSGSDNFLLLCEVEGVKISQLPGEGKR